MNYKGSCHCGRIAYEVEGEIGAVTQCNCSLCLRKGSLLWFVPREQLKMLTPEERSAISSFSADIFPKTISTEVRKPHGMVKVSEKGKR